MLQKYLVNFWVWWYFIQIREFGKTILRTWLYALGFTNLVPMITNLFRPLYQDYTIIGYVIGFIVRSVWSVFGLVSMFFITIPLLIIYLVMVILPLLPIIMILSYFVL